MRSGLRATGWTLLCALAVAGPSPADEETVVLLPTERAGWTVGNLFAPFGGLLRGNPDYWYEPRTLRIDTTPPGAAIDLFYVRRGFQKGYEQADAPVRVELPSRVEAGPSDAVMIRALLDGYRHKDVTVEVRSGQEEVVIDLEPLPNALLALTHLSLAGRASLGFVTKEAPTVRVRNADEGLQVVLVETALGQASEGLSAMRGSLVEEVGAQQLGEDLLIRIGLARIARDGGVEARSRQSFDPVRGTHLFALDLVPAEAGEPVARARAALARMDPAEVGGCAAVWDRSLRQQLEPADLARALSPRGEFTDPYLRAAMRRLGELQDDVVRLADGSRFRVSVPIELMAAAGQAHEVEGYLAALRSFVAGLEPAEHRREALRGLVAPQLPPERFAELVDAADAAERACRARAG